MILSLHGTVVYEQSVPEYELVFEMTSLLHFIMLNGMNNSFLLIFDLEERMILIH